MNHNKTSKKSSRFIFSLILTLFLSNSLFAAKQTILTSKIHVIKGISDKSWESRFFNDTKPAVEEKNDEDADITQKPVLLKLQSIKKTVSFRKPYKIFRPRKIELLNEKVDEELENKTKISDNAPVFEDTTKKEREVPVEKPLPGKDDTKKKEKVETQNSIKKSQGKDEFAPEENDAQKEEALKKRERLEELKKKERDKRLHNRKIN